jgi:mevalonate pyrophosphate decarboxylase
MIPCDKTVAKALPRIPIFNPKMNIGFSITTINTIPIVAIIAFLGAAEERNIALRLKNSCVKITLRNYIETVEALSESEYKEAEGFYIEALNRWG